MLHDQPTGCWTKFTKPNCAGYAVSVVDGQIIMAPATPLQYLDRWRVGNSFLGDSAEFWGMRHSTSGRSLVISQPDVPGEPPTWEELEDTFRQQFALQRLALSEPLGDYKSRSYFSGRIGVFDVRSLNCVLTASGFIVPIDVIPQVFTSAASKTLKASTGPD